jgi:hypothetical protein
MTGAPGEAPRPVASGAGEGRTVAYIVAIALAGFGEVLAAYRWVAPRLPAMIPVHYSVTGAVDGTATPLSFLVLTGTAIAALSATIGLVTVLSERSHALRHHHGRGFRGPLMLLQGCAVMISIPLIALLLLLSATGTSVPDVPIWAAIATFVPAMLPIALLLDRRSSGRSSQPSGPGGGEPAPGTGDDRAWEFRCSSCGEAFSRSSVSLLTPHMMRGGEGSLYLLCPRCGERDWDPLLHRPGEVRGETTR